MGGPDGEVEGHRGHAQVIRKAWRATIRFLGSAALAIGLLAGLGVWSVLGSVIPQGVASNPGVTAWASAYPALEPVVRAIGLHQAFTAPLFLVAILVLALSTALCAWQRTKGAMARMRSLRRAMLSSAQSLTERHDLEIACDPALGAPEALTLASDTLAHLGVKTRRRDGLIEAVSPRWSAWGSPVFHWALFALVAALLIGNLQRSQGLMGVAVGQTSPDAPVSYGILHAGPLHNWGSVHRSIRVDAFETNYITGGIGRGPTPTVSVLDAAGKVVKTQRVYPNMTLSTGSLTIYPDSFGLSANLSVLSTAGAELGHVFDFVDFSSTAASGTVPTQLLTFRGRAGGSPLTVSITIPLDRTAGTFVQAIPQKPLAHVVVTSSDGTPVLDRDVSPGQKLTLPTGLVVRLDGIGYYARLSVVDDWTVPLLYAGLVIAMVGLAITVVARQQIVLATVIEKPDGVTLAATVRLWRNASTSRSEIESELAKALSRVEKGSSS